MLESLCRYFKWTFLDQIWENIHSSHVRFCSFRHTQIPQGEIYRFAIFKDDKGLKYVVQQSLKVLHLHVIQNRFYGLPNLKKWMCELCIFHKSGNVYVTRFHIGKFILCGNQFFGIKISKDFADVYRTSKMFILETVWSNSLIAYHLSIIDNLSTKHFD